MSVVLYKINNVTLSWGEGEGKAYKIGEVRVCWQTWICGPHGAEGEGRFLLVSDRLTPSPSVQERIFGQRRRTWRLDSGEIEG